MNQLAHQLRGIRKTLEGSRRKGPGLAEGNVFRDLKEGRLPVPLGPMGKAKGREAL